MNVSIPWACQQCGKQNGTTRAANMDAARFKEIKTRIADAHRQETQCQAVASDILFWYRHGDCNQCGHCCEVVQPNFKFELPGEIRDAGEQQFLQTRGYTIEGKRAWILATVTAPCPQLTGPFDGKVDRRATEPADTFRCKVWDDRPGTCAEFPITPAQVRGTPCSYWFEREDGRKVGGNDSPHPWRTKP